MELTSSFGLRKVLWRKGTIAWRKCQQRKTLPLFPGRPDVKLMLRWDTSCFVHPQRPSMSLPELHLQSVLQLHPASDQPPRLQHSFQKKVMPTETRTQCRAELPQPPFPITHRDCSVTELQPTLSSSLADMLSATPHVLKHSRPGREGVGRGGDNRRTVAWRKLLFTRSCCKKIQVWIAGMNTKWQVIATWLSYLHFPFQHCSRSHLLKKNRLTERNMSHWQWIKNNFNLLSFYKHKNPGNMTVRLSSF